MKTTWKWKRLLLSIYLRLSSIIFQPRKFEAFIRQKIWKHSQKVSLKRNYWEKKNRRMTFQQLKKKNLFSWLKNVYANKRRIFPCQGEVFSNGHCIQTSTCAISSQMLIVTMRWRWRHQLNHHFNHHTGATTTIVAIALIHQSTIHVETISIHRSNYVV